PVLGVVPYVDDVPVAAEDSLDLDGRHGAVAADIDVAVVRIPRIANFDDFEPLAREPRIRVRFVRDPAELAATDLIVLPGSKNTIGDLAWLRATGLADAIVAVARTGRPVLGVCGGYQMLGETLRDPLGIESAAGEAPAL